MTLMSFQRKYRTDEDCLQAIFEARWPRGFLCPKCGHDFGYRLSQRRSIQCAACRKQTSITSGTLFERSKVPLQKWFWLIYLMSQDKGGISTVRAAELLEMHYATVWFMMHKLRVAMGNRLDGRTLSGLVEIDDAFFGGKTKGKTGRGAHGKLNVVVIVERLNRHAGDAALIVLPDQLGDTLKAAVETVLEPMTHIRTDGLPKNSSLHGLAGKLNMDTIGRNYSETGPLKNADRVISLAKRYLLGTYHQYCSRAHLQRFLNEFSFRFNRRYHWSQLFSRTLAAAALNPPVRYAALS
jgi:transposase-like protein